MHSFILFNSSSLISPACHFFIASSHILKNLSEKSISSQTGSANSSTNWTKTVSPGCHPPPLAVTMVPGSPVVGSSWMAAAAGVGAGVSARLFHVTTTRAMMRLTAIRLKKAMSQGHSAAWDMDWEQAAAYYGQAVDEFPENQQALASLGGALLELKRYKEALPYYQKAAKMAPDDPISGRPIFKEDSGFYLGCQNADNAFTRSFHGIIGEVRISNIARYTEDFTPQRRFEPD